MVVQIERKQGIGDKKIIPIFSNINVLPGKGQNLSSSIQIATKNLNQAKKTYRAVFARIHVMKKRSDNGVE